MLLILPVIAFVLFLQTLRDQGLDWRRGILAAAVFWGTSVVLVTETLSVPRLLTQRAVGLYWLIICIAAFFYRRIIRLRTRQRSTSKDCAPSEHLDSTTAWLLVGAGVLVVLIGITATIAPPNVWDAMEYHLPRVMMWMSQHSVRFFATPDYAQLIFGPWAEYGMLHADLLWGGDRFVNLVEFFGFLGCLVGASLVAKILGAGARGQALAAVICATIPEAVLEASGPMNTVVVSFWIIATIVFLMSWNEDPSWLNTVCIGLSAGLALLTKGNAYVYLPFLALACWWMGSHRIRLRFLKVSPILLLLILAVNGPQFARAYDLTGSPLGLPFRDGGPRLHWMVGRFSAQDAAANILRNISLHVFTPSPAINDRIDQAVRSIIRAIGRDPDDPQTTWPDNTFHANHFSLHEIHAGNPLHMALLLLSIGLILLRKHNGRVGRAAPLYALGVVGGFVLFCILLRWQIWAGRHHLPIFVLGSALIGFVVERYFPRQFGPVVALVLMAYVLPFALSNRIRSLLPWSGVEAVYQGRSALYFADMHTQHAAANIAAADAVTHLDCPNVAIDSYTAMPASSIKNSPLSFYVYPILALIQQSGRTRRVWYTGVKNWSRRYMDRDHHSEPCAVICLECANVHEKWAEYSRVGGRASLFDYIVVFTFAGTLPNVVSGAEADPAEMNAAVRAEEELR